MKRHLTPTFWIEAILAGISALFLILTLVWEDWIEVFFDASPDNGDGSLEWTIAIVCIVCAVIFSALARHEWRRTLRAQAQ
jgi:hypothetical protein